MKLRALAAAAMVVGMTLAWPAIGADAEAGANDLAQPNPEAVTGRLANGLRYTIQQHAAHNRESLQLHIDAGSRDETDAEQGVAHFLEHMAFVGPKHFQASDLVARFAQAGIAWGRDQNAFTTYDGTTFTLDIPEVNDDKLDLSFLWLGDVADGLRFEPAAVDPERGVVLQEYFRGLGPAREVSRRTDLFAAPGLRGTIRPAIGTEQTIRAADAATLQQFYQRWYRPENAILVAVGDEPVETIRHRIEATFGSWRAEAPPAPRFDGGAVDPRRPTDFLAITEPKVPTSVSICRYGDKDPLRPESVATHRLDLADRVWSTSLNRRFLTLAGSGAPPFLRASAARIESFRTVGLTCLAGTPLNDDWRTALTALSAEARRMSIYGVTQPELDYVKAQVTTELDQEVASQVTWDAAPIASVILDNYENGGTYDSAVEDRRVILKALSQVDLATVHDAFGHRWDHAAAPLIIVTTPKPVTSAEVQAVWTTAQATPPPPPPQAHATAAWAYGAFGPPGKVARREVLSDPDFVRLTFDNGVVVNFKQTAFAKNQVDVEVRFGAGQRELPPGQLWQAMFGSALLRVGGLGKNSAADLDEICRDHECAAALAAGRSAFDLGGATRPQDLQLELQLLAAILTDPGFNPSVDKRIPSAVHATFRQIDSNPVMVAALALVEALPQPHVIDLPPEDEAAGMSQKLFRGLLERPMKTDALEITLVGDVDEATATTLLASTFGALAPRERVDRTRPDAISTLYPATAPPRLTVQHSGPHDKAAVIMVWPTEAMTPERTHEGRVIALMSEILRTKVLDQVRRKLGQTYSPSVSASLDPGGDQNAISAVIETSPQDVDAVIREVDQIAAACAAGDISAEALEQVRKPLQDSAAQQRTYNGWWMGVLNGSLERPDKLTDTRTMDHDLATIGLDEVRAQARRWLAAPPITIVSAPAPATP